MKKKRLKWPNGSQKIRSGVDRVVRHGSCSVHCLSQVCPDRKNIMLKADLGRLLPFDNRILTVTATRYLPPYTPYKGPLDPLPFKGEERFTCLYRSIRPTSGVTPIFFLHPSTPYVGPLDPVTCKEEAPLYWVYGSIRPTTGFDYPRS